MSDRWGDSQRDRDQLDNWITRDRSDDMPETISETLTDEEWSIVHAALRILSEKQTDEIEALSWTTLSELEDVVKGKL